MCMSVSPVVIPILLKADGGTAAGVGVTETAVSCRLSIHGRSDKIELESGGVNGWQPLELMIGSAPRYIAMSPWWAKRLGRLISWP
jgi:hypothetical protein